MVVPGFARNLISVGRLTEKGNQFVAGKEGPRYLMILVAS